MSNPSQTIDIQFREPGRATRLAAFVAKLAVALARAGRKADQALWTYTEAQSKADTSSFNGLL